MSEKNAIADSDAPVTTHSLTKDLEQIGVTTGSILLVHSSLSALGWVCGGAVAVIDALQNAIGATGTLVMPSHSSALSDPSQWSNPPVPEDWWPTIRAEMPAFDLATTPTRGMGVIAESFRSRPKVVRSNHPQMSFSASGPQAAKIVANHQLEDGLGEGSPLARMYELDAFVLLLGVSHENNTSLHLAELRALTVGEGRPVKLVESGAPLMVDGQREWVTFRTADVESADFEELGRDFATQDGAVSTAAAGAGQALLMRQRTLVDFGVKWIAEKRPGS